MEKVILHISNDHSSFDDRIYYKELISLSFSYKCYLIAGGTVKGSLNTMGQDMLTPGLYNNIMVLPFPIGKIDYLFMRIVRKMFHIMYKKIYDYIYYHKLIVTCKKNNITPLIIHYHDLNLFIIAKKLKKHFNCKLIFDCHEYYFSYPIDRELNYLNLLKSAQCLMSIKKAISNSDAVISTAINCDNMISLMKNNNHIVIYNTSVLPVRSGKNIGKDKIVLVHEGSMKFNRGLRLMLDIFNDTYFREHIKLKIVGDIYGDERKYFEQKKQEYQIDDSMIEVTGWIKYEELSKYLIGNIGIMFFEKSFTTYYSMPNKLFNYISSGLPILCVHGAESSDFIFQNKIGCIVERDSDSIKIGINTIIENYDFYLNNILNAQGSFSWRNDEKKLLELYGNLI
jgi:glycosyltransferase involved in cell wall biosynthesis